MVVCAYQAQDTIEECLQSLMELDYPNYDVLVVDDGSTDATAEIARRFPVRLLIRDRLGLSGARNEGLEQADGDIVAYIDADAWADPDWLTYLALALEVPGTAGAGGPTRYPQTIRRLPSAWRVRQDVRPTCSWTMRGPSMCRAATWLFGASAFWRWELRPGL